MERLDEEIQAVIKKGYRLRFRVPTPEELARMRQIHRELTASERQRIQQVEQNLRAVIEALEKGDLDIENLPVDLRGALGKYFAGKEPLPDDGQ